MHSIAMANVWPCLCRYKNTSFCNQLECPPTFRPTFAQMEENLKELTGHTYYEAVERLTNLAAERFGDLRSPEASTEVLGIARGGLIPATYLVYQLGCPLNVLYLRSYPKPNVQKEVESYGVLPFRTRPLPKRVIVVDDIQDTGKSFDFVKDFFKTNFPDIETELVYCVVVYREREGLKPPDLYGSKTASEDWVIFPYDPGID